MSPFFSLICVHSDDKAHLYTQYGLEGVSNIWKDDFQSFLCSGGIVRASELVEGGPLMPKKIDSSIINQLIAHRFLNVLYTERDVMSIPAAKRTPNPCTEACGCARANANDMQMSADGPFSPS